jgi:V/A-type H+/Na+-transporting ATPase subunit D
MAEEIIEGVNPTRMELLKLKDRANLATKGHKLLKEKRDALIMEFFNILDRARGVREKVDEKLGESFSNLVIAQAMMGDFAVKKAAMSVPQSLSIDVDTRSVMGVTVPVIEYENIKKSFLERGYGLVDTSAKLDETSKSFEETVELILELSEVEMTVKLLAGEIESTKRRVNALEHIIIPRLDATVKYIEMRLEEMERENFVRLKMIKQTMEE